MRQAASAVPYRIDHVGVGLILFAAGAGWSLLSAWRVGASVAMAVAILAMGAAVFGAWAISSRWPVAVPGAVVAVAVALVALDPSRIFDPGPRQGPFGYANASAAFFALASIASLMLAALTRHAALRAILVVLATASVPLIVASRSWAVALLLPSLIALAIVTVRLATPRAAVAAAAAVFSVALISTQLIGASELGVGGGPVDRVVASTLSVDRVRLWHEAMVLAVGDPVLGVGPGRFAVSSPFAAADPDRGWAHHEFLQAAAETGVPGYLAAVGLVGWAFVALWVSARGAVAILAAVGLALVASQATIDYILHFPAVSLGLAAIVGTGLAAPKPGSTLLRSGATR